MSERPEVSLRRFEPGDAGAVHRWFNNPEATKTLMEQRDGFPLEEAEAWVRRAMDDSGEDRKYAIVVEGYEEPVGFTALYGLFRQTAPELGALIGDDVRGKGVGRRAEALTIAKAFDEFGAHRVYGRIPARNEVAKKTVVRPRLAARGDDARPPAPSRRRRRLRGLGRAAGRVPRRRRRPARPEMSAPGGTGAVASLLADAGAATQGEEFFRSRPFLDAEGVTHTLRIEAGEVELLAPLIVREIPGGGLDAISPYGYPGIAKPQIAGWSIDPPIEGSMLQPTVQTEEVDFSATGLVSVFIRHTLAEPPLAGAAERNVVQIADPALPPKSRGSDRNRINKNRRAGYEVQLLAGAETSADQRAGFLTAYEQTMRRTGAAERYFFAAAYFDRILESDLAWLALAQAPEGGVAAASIAVRSDGFLHYYLSGSADSHLRDSPMKNVVAALVELSAELGLPLNLGGGIAHGDALEEFKRGFANREQAWHSSEIVCDRVAYDAPLGGARRGRLLPRLPRALAAVGSSRRGACSARRR